MRSLMGENESEGGEEEEGGWRGGGGFWDCKQITLNSVSDWSELEMLETEGGREG